MLMKFKHHITHIHWVDIVVFCLSWGWLGYPPVHQCLRHPPWPDPSMVASMVAWCRQNGSRNYAALPSPSTPLHCTALHSCTALQCISLPHPSTGSLDHCTVQCNDALQCTVMMHCHTLPHPSTRPHCVHCRVNNTALNCMLFYHSVCSSE